MTAENTDGVLLRAPPGVRLIRSHRHRMARRLLAGLVRRSLAVGIAAIALVVAGVFSVVVVSPLVRPFMDELHGQAPGSEQIPPQVPATMPEILPAGKAGPSALAPAPRSYTGADCHFLPPAGYAVECGFLTVPEDRSQADGRTVQIHVAVVRSRSESPAPDPLVYLHGGPGARALNDMALYLPKLEPVLQDRDLIIFDQRGVGSSRPALDCPERTLYFAEILDQALAAAERVMGEVEANLACHDRLLSEGIHLPAYTSVASAADLNDLRLALGYDNWNLFGVSYGSRLALTAMRDYPEGIRSVVLDSVYPLDVDLYADWAQNAQLALDRIFEWCALDAGCRVEHPDLALDFEVGIRRLMVDPLRLAIPGSDRLVSVDGNVMTGLVARLLLAPAAAAQMPKLIQEMHAASHPLLSALSLALVFPENISQGMHYAVQCAEEAAFGGLKISLAKNATVSPAIRDHFNILSQVVFQTCAGWQVNPANHLENQPVYSDIPTLAIMGEHDPITPPDWGRQALAGLPNGALLVVPQGSHFVLLDQPCVGRISRLFILDPGSRRSFDCEGRSLPLTTTSR